MSKQRFRCFHECVQRFLPAALAQLTFGKFGRDNDFGCKGPDCAKRPACLDPEKTDMDRIAQMQPNNLARFVEVDMKAALAARATYKSQIARLRAALRQ